MRTTSSTLQVPREVFDRQLAALDEALPHAAREVRDLLLHIRHSAVRIKTELDDIRASAPLWAHGKLPVCFDCGAKDLEVVYTSRSDRCQLCPACFEFRQQRGLARETTGEGKATLRPA
ncbi:hypothetical protein [Candidatus Nitrospira bockiana]